MRWQTFGDCREEGYVNCTFATTGPCLNARHNGGLNLKQEKEKEDDERDSRRRRD